MAKVSQHAFSFIMEDAVKMHKIHVSASVRFSIINPYNALSFLVDLNVM